MSVLSKRLEVNFAVLVRAGCCFGLFGLSISRNELFSRAFQNNLNLNLALPEPPPRRRAARGLQRRRTVTTTTGHRSAPAGGRWRPSAGRRGKFGVMVGAVAVGAATVALLKGGVAQEAQSGQQAP
jgi:hypothetical protein